MIHYTFLSKLAQLFLECEMFQTKVVKKSKHTFYVQELFSKNCAGYEMTWKNNCRAGQATD
jgi:hypothetical protein